MKVISISKIAKEKVDTIQSGYTAFTETAEIAQRMRKELDSLGIGYLEEKTTKGSWFIPQKRA